MAMVQATPRLCVVRRLHTLEPIVNRLLTLQKPLLILKEKLEQIEELISTMPDEEINSVPHEWRPKLARWWRDFAEVVMQDSTMYSFSPYRADLVTNDLGQPTNAIEPYRVKRLKDKFHSRIPSPTSIYSVDVCKVMGAAEIRAELDKVFSSVPVLESTSDLVGMKRLITQVVRTFDLVPPEAKNPDLQSHFFSLVFDKFPESVRELFLVQYDRFSVYTLFSFLRLEIESQLDVGNIRAALPPISELKADCWYCHKNGHLSYDCPELFCVQCFQLGHTKANCERGPIFA